VQYQADTGELLKAEFFDINGHMKGKLNGTATFGPFCPFICGAFVIFGAFKTRRRDPEGVDEPDRTSSSPSDAVDENSLPHFFEPPSEKHR